MVVCSEAPIRSSTLGEETLARITVLGGTGYAGSAVVAEAARRGHDVTSASRRDPPKPLDGVTYVVGSVLDDDVLRDSVNGRDVVVEALSPRGDMAGRVEGVVARLMDLCASDGARLGIIGGASSLLVSEDGPRLFDAGSTRPRRSPRSRPASRCWR